EAYVPKPKRKLGYFALPVLVGEDIVAALDLKTDRQNSKLLMQKWNWVGAGKTDGKDLQCTEDGGVEIGKLVLGIDPGAAHQMKQVGVVPREQEKVGAGGYQRRLAGGFSGGRFLQPLSELLPAAFCHPRQQRQLVGKMPVHR